MLTKGGSTVLRFALPLLLFTVASPAAAQDLSAYRGFQLGSGLPAVAARTGGTVSQPAVIHSRPALIQELEWSPRSLGPSPGAESVQAVTFSFYNGALFRIEVRYDRYATEGLTANDFVEAISAMYGPPARLPQPLISVKDIYGDPQKTVARWESQQYRFDLLSASDGPGFTLVGILKSLEAPFETASREAKRLDDLEAPQREAAREAAERHARTAALEKARLVNRPNFRP